MIIMGASSGPYFRVVSNHPVAVVTSPTNTDIDAALKAIRIACGAERKPRSPFRPSLARRRK